MKPEISGCVVANSIPDLATASGQICEPLPQIQTEVAYKKKIKRNAFVSTGHSSTWKCAVSLDHPEDAGVGMKWAHCFQG